MGSVDQTMPALFASSAGGASEVTPLAQLGVGPDGTAVLARRGEQLIEILQLSFGPSSPRWAALEARLRTAGAVDHPGVRGVLAIEPSPPAVILEGNSSPPLAELIGQATFDLERAMKILGELARAIAAAHHVGLVVGRLDPWAIHVGANDRPRIELTGLAMRSLTHEWIARCTAPEAIDGVAEPASDVYAVGALLDIIATTQGRAAPTVCAALVAEGRPRAIRTPAERDQLVRSLIGASTLVRSASQSSGEQQLVRPSRPGLGLSSAASSSRNARRWPRWVV